MKEGNSRHQATSIQLLATAPPRKRGTTTPPKKQTEKNNRGQGPGTNSPQKTKNHQHAGGRAHHQSHLPKPDTTCPRPDQQQQRHPREGPANRNHKPKATTQDIEQGGARAGPAARNPLQQKQPEQADEHWQSHRPHQEQEGKKPEAEATEEPRRGEEETSQQLKKNSGEDRILATKPQSQGPKQRHQPRMGNCCNSRLQSKTQPETGSNRNQAKEPHITQKGGQRTTRDRAVKSKQTKKETKDHPREDRAPPGELPPQEHQRQRLESETGKPKNMHLPNSTSRKSPTAPE
ncbi:hypothetical protein NDU88_002373 [Pleurodeles waltl]|uniref:Uncharacterized protein n=1 Tax=Pleurodeles waltl TaxID=8319 RepID=A0AAV7Q6P8_PLEWA|nr:hypothetical protein NDU88_002373 [Pleurodeles waltl]